MTSANIYKLSSANIDAMTSAITQVHSFSISSAVMGNHSSPLSPLSSYNNNHIGGVNDNYYATA